MKPEEEPAPSHANATAFLDAADVARSRYANARAVEYYAKGLALLGERSAVVGTVARQQCHIAAAPRTEGFGAVSEYQSCVHLTTKGIARIRHAAREHDGGSDVDQGSSVRIVSTSASLSARL